MTSDPTPNPAIMETFVRSAAMTHSTIMGERRQLSPAEERNLAKAHKLMKKARKLKARAHKLRKRAEKLEPENLYPNSLFARYIDRARLPRGSGVEVSIPKWGSLTMNHLGDTITPTYDRRLDAPEGDPEAAP